MAPSAIRAGISAGKRALPLGARHQCVAPDARVAIAVALAGVMIAEFPDRLSIRTVDLVDLVTNDSGGALRNARGVRRVPRLATSSCCEETCPRVSRHGHQRRLIAFDDSWPSFNFSRHASQHTSTVFPPIVTLIAFASSGASQAAHVFAGIAPSPEPGVNQ
jgi:hypothetical protein